MAEAKAKSATLKSIALATGFSVTTVSRALSGYSDVSEETRQLILSEARQQGYEPNLHARALQGQLARTIGLVIPTYGPRYSDPFFSTFIAGVGNKANRAGFDLLLSTHAPGPGELEAYRRMIGGQRVDGLIVLRTRRNDPRIAFLLDSGLPFVVYGRSDAPREFVYIDVDGEAGQRALTGHLIAMGHRRIAYITPPGDLMFTFYRLAGFRAAMSEHGLPVDETLVVEGELTEESGRRVAARLLALPEPPTAIMTGNDLAALGAMSAVQERGLRVGEDVAVAGFDDIPAAEHVHPGLTTLRQPINEIAEQATEYLLTLISGGSPPSRATLLMPELVIRASSLRARRR